jgi:hypothetical protein
MRTGDEDEERSAKDILVQQARSKHDYQLATVIPFCKMARFSFSTSGYICVLLWIPIKAIPHWSSVTRNKRTDMAVRMLSEKMKQCETQMEESEIPFHQRFVSEILRSG